VFQEYYKDLIVQTCYASIAHPESNGQLKRANAEILRGLKTRTYDCLKKHGAKWIDKLSCALWTNWTSSSQAMGETPFFLVYGAEAIIPSKITMVSPRVQAHDEAMKDQLRCDDVDLIDERRWQEALQNARYHQALRHYHQLFVHSRQLQVDDLVLHRRLTREGTNKLSPHWEGPFRVTQVCHPGCVCLATKDGTPLPNSWNIEHLHKFYP
jgi:hypothetical protein